MGIFFQFTHDQPFPHPANSVGRVYPEFFRVSTLCRVRKERTAIKFRKGCTVCFIRATRNYRKLWLLHHCTKDFCPGLNIIAKKKTFSWNPPCWAVFHPVDIKVVKNEIWNSFPANWMQLSCIFVLLKHTCQGLFRSFSLIVKLKVKWIQKGKCASFRMERKRPMSGR